MILSGAVATIATVASAQASVLLDIWTTAQSIAPTYYDDGTVNLAVGSAFNTRYFGASSPATGDADGRLVSMTGGSGSLSVTFAATPGLLSNGYAAIVWGADTSVSLSQQTAIQFNVTGIVGSFQAYLNIFDGSKYRAKWVTVNSEGLQSLSLSDWTESNGGTIKMHQITNLTLEFWSATTAAEQSITIGAVSAVPAPGALVLLAAGGIAGSRRRTF